MSLHLPPARSLPGYDVGRSLSTDYFGLRDQLSEDELALLLKARAFVDDEVLPVIGDFWERAEFPRELARRMGELGLVGDGITGPGCPPMTPPARAWSTWRSTAATAAWAPSSASSRGWP